MVSQPIRVLLVEDDPVDALLVRRGLAGLANGDRWLIDYAPTLRQGLECLAKRAVDVVLLDLHLPDADGLEAIEEMIACTREHELPVPVVVLTSSTEREMALAALRCGAQDYIVKDELHSYTLLQRALRYALERQRATQLNQLLEERLRQSEQLEGAGVLAAGVAFSFHVLLGRMFDEVDQATDELGDAGRSGAVSHRLLEIRRHLSVASELSDQLRSWMAGPPLPVADIDPSTFVLEMAQLIEGIVQSPVQIRYQLPPGLPGISFCPIELRQVLLAFVMNAVQAIGQQPGRIVIETGVMHVNDELLRRTHGALHLAPGSFVFFSVSDDGPGLTPDVRKRLFDPFFTTRSAGRGLGLFMALGAVRRHGGAIFCSSEAGHGVRFTVLLPPGASPLPRSNV
jgi:signal transduction histidine kinase